VRKIDEGCEKIFNHYGVQGQLTKLLEELGELSAETNDLILSGNKHKYLFDMNFISEVADVMVLCNQFVNAIQEHHGKDLVQDVMIMKIERQLRRIANETT